MTRIPAKARESIPAELHALWDKMKSRTRDKSSRDCGPVSASLRFVELTWRIALCGVFNRFNDVLQVDHDAGRKPRPNDVRRCS